MSIKSFLLTIALIFAFNNVSYANCIDETQVKNIAYLIIKVFKDPKVVSSENTDTVLIFDRMRKVDIQIDHNITKFIAIMPSNFNNNNVIMFLINNKGMTCPGNIMVIPGNKWGLITDSILLKNKEPLL